MARHRNRHPQRTQLFSAYGDRILSICTGEALEMLRVRVARLVKARKDGTPEIIQLCERQQEFIGEMPITPGDNQVIVEPDGTSRVRRPATASDASSPSLLLGDVEANAFGAAGLAWRRRGKVILWADDHGRLQAIEATGNRVDRAMSKVEAWPEVGDTRAVRVGPKCTH